MKLRGDRPYRRGDEKVNGFRVVREFLTEFWEDLSEEVDGFRSLLRNLLTGVVDERRQYGPRSRPGSRDCISNESVNGLLSIWFEYPKDRSL